VPTVSDVLVVHTGGGYRPKLNVGPFLLTQSNPILYEFKLVNYVLQTILMLTLNRVKIGIVEDLEF